MEAVLLEDVEDEVHAKQRPVGNSCSVGIATQLIEIPLGNANLCEVLAREPIEKRENGTD